MEYKIVYVFGGTSKSEAKELEKMDVLRITQSWKDRASVQYQTSDNAYAEWSAELPPPLTWGDEENIRWIVEDYISFPMDPAPQWAARIEQRIRDIGIALFSAVFLGKPEHRQRWESIRPTLSRTRIEVVCAEGCYAKQPWELMREAATQPPLCVAAQSFAQLAPKAAGQSLTVEVSETLRILLVIARPRGRSDIPLRTIAGHIVHQLSNDHRVQIQVLRPPTIWAFEQVLQQAQQEGRPYHIVHFDGHGIFDDIIARLSGIPARNKRGYLLFENPEASVDSDFIDGQRLGSLLAACGTVVFILNACRSGMSQSPAEGARGTAFASVAEEILMAGVPAVTAMRYNLYEETAGRFIASLYQNIVAGLSVGEAIASARQTLYRDRSRSSSAGPLLIDDWYVPIAFEHGPVRFNLAASKTPPVSHITPRHLVPPGPAWAIVGRDDILLELERKFEQTNIVLITGMAGSGKSAVAAEFARWLADTGGAVDGVIYSSLTHLNSAVELAHEALHAFTNEQSANGNKSLPPFTKADNLDLTPLTSRALLWVWDDVDALGGRGKKQRDALYAELWELATQSTSGGVKLLLTSRRTELQGVPCAKAPIALSPLALEDGFELANVLHPGTKRQSAIEHLESWLTFSQGNPGVIIGLLSEGAKLGYLDKDARALIGQPPNPGVASALLQSCFPLDNETLIALQADFAQDQALLSPLCLFEGFVNSNMLQFILNQRGESDLKLELNSPDDEAASLLARLADMGLLAYKTGSNQYYHVHPALPLLLAKSFTTQYPSEQSKPLLRGFVWILAATGDIFLKQYQAGKYQSAEIAVETLQALEHNTMNALSLAIDNYMWHYVANLLEGMWVLSHQEGWQRRYQQVLDEFLPHLMNLKTGKALPGREKLWIHIQQHRINEWIRTGRLDMAEAQQIKVVEQQRKNGREASEDQKESNRHLVLELNTLANIKAQRGNEGCIALYDEALVIAQRIGDAKLEAVVAYQLAGVYMVYQQWKDLDKAEYWLTYALEVTAEDDSIGRAMMLQALGAFYFSCFNTQDLGHELQLQYLQQAIECFESALRIVPAGQIHFTAKVHANLGLAYFSRGYDIERSLPHYQQALQLSEQLEDVHTAATVRLNMARMFNTLEQYDKARVFAESALRALQALGVNAKAELEEAQAFLLQLQQPEHYTTKEVCDV